MWITKQTENAEQIKLTDATSKVIIWAINHADSPEISRLGNLTHIPFQGFSNSDGTILVNTSTLGITVSRQKNPLSCNYPVMQSLDEPNFYLKHGFDRGYTDYGCPYVGENCDVSKPSDNLIIYGHHMKNGSMFSDLEKFKKKDFWEEHKTVSFNTLYEKQTYEVIAVFKTVVYTGSANEFKYFQFSDAKTPEQFDEYIAKCKEKALYDTGVSAEYGDKLITLSTCEYSNTNGRLVLVAKRVVD